MAELSLSERLRIVSDPRPAEFNPDEEDWELLSGTRLSQSRTYDDQGTAFSSSVGRKGGVSSAGSKIRVAADETEPDPQYAGRPVSRRELFGATEDANEEVELESETDQSDEELESGDNQEERRGRLGPLRLSFSVSESEEEEEERGVSDEEEEGRKEGGAEEGEREEEGERGGGFTALAMDKVQEDIDKGKAVREQIITTRDTLQSVKTLPRLLHDRTRRETSVYYHKRSGMLIPYY
ncbi:hypothetical protein GBAR_LOCUS14626, partial [Geodia barretti]